MLNQFISTIGGQDVSRQNRFAVSVYGPGGMAERQINMLCEAASFPGQNVRTTADSLRAGPAREVGQGTTYGPITLRFLCRPGLPEKKYFEDWQELMFSKETWQVNYYKNYVGEIVLDQLDRHDRSRYTVTMYEAYPKIITAQDFSYQSDNAYQTLSVEFTYFYWDSDNSGRSVSVTRHTFPTTTQKTKKKQDTGWVSDPGQDDMDDDWDMGGNSSGKHPAFTHHNSNNARGE